MVATHRLLTVASSTWTGFVAAVVVPIAITFVVSWLRWPAFVFEHLVILLVLAIAVAWELRQAVVSAVAAVGADNILLREPIGQPAITGYRDLIDLAMFVAVAIVISWLVSNAHRQRRAAQQSEQRERRARQDRDRLIATISHDLATPLSVLRGTLQFARKAGQKEGADLDRLLVRLEIATDRATSLVKTLTDAQAVDTEGLHLNLTKRDLRALVLPIAEMMDRLSDRHPVVVSMPDAPMTVQCDADRLQRVIENLLNNAIKYSPDGGAVELSIAAEDGAAVLRVRDYGIGISPEALPRIFERSYRAPEAAAAAPGLGLGLNIAAHVIEGHGGTIQAEPAEGGGTVISIRLPLAGRGSNVGTMAAAHS
jgi:signal transduction histidine kinase